MRALLVLGGVLAAVVAAGAVRADAETPEFAASAALEEVEEPSRHLRAYPLGRQAAAEAPAVRRVRLGASRDLALLLVDVNGDGDFGDRGVDGWTRDDPAFRYLVPLEASFVVGATHVRWAIEDGTFRYTATPADGAVGVPDDGKGKDARSAARDVVAGLAAWNDVRLAHGLVPVQLDAELSDGCRQHALYCAANGITHRQYPELPYATPAGAETARWCGIGAARPAEEVDLAFRSLYHRIQLIHPTTVEAGIGAARGIAVLDGSRGRRMFGAAARTRRKWDYPVRIPAPGTTDIPRTFSVESPRPHPGVFSSDKALQSAGFPITVTFLHGRVADVTAELRKDGPEGKEVPFLLSSPESPANSEIPDNYKTIALLPRRALAARTTHWVRVVYTPTDVDRARPVTLTWTFETAR